MNRRRRRKTRFEVRKVLFISLEVKNVVLCCPFVIGFPISRSHNALFPGGRKWNGGVVVPFISFHSAIGCEIMGGNLQLRSVEVEGEVV